MCAPHHAPAAAQAPVLTGAKRAVTEEDVVKVHTAIEACLKRNMTKEATCTVLQRFGVDAAFTSLVWQRLELENPEWFLNYYKQLQTLESLRSLQLAA